VFHQLLQEVRPSVFIDIGANIGYYTLLAAGQGVPRAVAVEASRASPRVSSATSRLNRPDVPDQSHPAAISDRGWNPHILAESPGATTSAPGRSFPDPTWGNARASTCRVIRATRCSLITRRTHPGENRRRRW